MKNNILINPILTEKATKLASLNTYMFNVDLRSNKNQIKKAIQEIYPVKIKKITTHNIHGKIVRRGKKGLLKKMPDRKVAYITIKEGKIDIFPKV